MAERRHFSQCMRQHGLSDWPDPKADGSFPIVNGPYKALVPNNPEQPSPEIQRAYDACFDIQRDWRITAS